VNPFTDPNQVSALVAECQKWAGTPFVPHQAVRGAGADCVRWVAAVLGNLGLIRSTIPFPSDYPVAGGGLQALSTLRGVLDTIPELKTAWRREQALARPILGAGDLLVFSTFRAQTHLALFTTWPVFWHCSIVDGVCEGNITDPQFARTLCDIYRIAL
jgi:hypothetical protein